MTTESIPVSELTTLADELLTTTGSDATDMYLSSPSPTSDEGVVYPKVVTMTTMSLLSLAITINLIAFATSICDPRRKCSRANIWAVSFFTAEIVYSLNAMIALYKHVFMSPTDFDKLIAHAHLFVEFVSRGAMVISLAGVAVDRYHAICDVKSYCSRRRLRASCCYAMSGWLVAVLLAVPVLAGLTDFWYATFNSLRPFDVYTSIHTGLIYFIPLIVFSVVYNGLMCRLISCSGRNSSLDSFASSEGGERQCSTQRRLTAGIIVTVVVFVFSWLPYLTVRVVAGYFPSADFQPLNTEEMRLVGNVLAYIGLAVCPILVCVVCADYKSLDASRKCACCPDSPGLAVKSEKAWPSTKQNPYYFY